MEVISLKGVYKSFGKNKVLQNINLSVEEGDIFGIVGPSGEGKSVLIKILLGFFGSDKGKRILSVSQNKIGFSMQNNSLYENLTTIKNIKYFAKMYGVKRKVRKEYIPQILNFLELENFKKTMASKLSGGTKKRLDIACALVNDPEILILDEPFLGLDPERISHLLEVLKALNQKGTTLIISSHRVQELSGLCTKIGLIKNGGFSMIQKKDLETVYKK